MSADTVRRSVDRPYPDCFRVGLYRLLDSEQAAAVEAEVRRRGAGQDSRSMATAN